jgi:hypothetical protein
MKRTFTTLARGFTLLTLLAITGCVNATKPLTGSMGPWKVYRSTAQTFAGPNLSTLHLYDGTNAPQFVYGASGEALGPVTIKAVAGVAGLATGGYLLGSSLRPAKTSIDNSAHNESWAQGGVQ